MPNPAVIAAKPTWLKPLNLYYWDVRLSDNIAHSREKPVNLLFEGDSITDYWREKQGNAVWMQHYDKLNAYDFGVAGDKTQNVLWRLQHGEVDGLHPKLIVLLIGANNLEGGDSPEQTAEGIHAVVAELRKRCPDSPILLQGIFPSRPFSSDPIRAKIKATNNLISAFADGKWVIYLHFGERFLEPDGSITVETMTDFEHPAAKGYQIWADAIQPVIDRYFPGKS